MGEAYFYHLTRAPLEATLPTLLVKAQGASWRVVVRGTDPARIDWLGERLWLEPGFLAHGRAGGEFDADQPVLLTTGPEAANGARCLMAIDGAEVAPDEVRAFERVCILFDGNDEAAVEGARAQWRALTTAGCGAKYWRQDDGAWSMKSESPAQA